jgi:transcription elongation factor SPT4
MTSTRGASQPKVSDEPTMDQTKPKDLRKLVACMGCGLIKNASQFDDFGCENCVFLGAGADYTTPHFAGFTAVLAPKESWAAGYLGHGNKVAGIYASKVEGVLGDDHRNEFENLDLTPFVDLKR